MEEKTLLACIKPDWEKGTIQKRVAISFATETFIPFKKFDPEKMTHFQEVMTGDFLFIATYNLKTSKVTSELVRLLASGRTVTYRDVNIDPVGMGEVFKKIRDVRNIMFSDFGSYIELGNLEMNNFDVKDPLLFREVLLHHLEKADPEMYQYLVDELSFSFMKDLPLDWGKALRLPKWLNNRSRLVTDHEGKTVKHTSEHWLLIHASGKATFPELEPTKGAQISAESGRTIKMFNATPQAMPDDVTFAVKIVLGANPVDDTMRGVSWILYRAETPVTVEVVKN